MDIKKLANIELYYSPSSLKHKDLIHIEGEELHHIINVMRHKAGDELYITDGKGKIYKTLIRGISADKIETGIVKEFQYEDPNTNIIFCLPRLRSADRFEYALEKCTELGITNFIIFDSERTIPKGNKDERWRKIITAAMKQSLRSYLPSMNFVKSVGGIAEMDGRKILLTQESDLNFSQSAINKESKNYFIFGPEGDFTQTEKDMFDKNDSFNLGNHRLRSETAIIKCASIISVR